jgi:iron(III) transport system substrate-binding protein
MTLPIRAALITAATALSVQASVAQEVNVYSYRQPELVEPLFNAFTEETGIKVNVPFLNKGVVEKLEAEGKRSPADLVLTVDVSQLDALIKAGVTQSVDSDAINANIPEAFRDSDGHWFGLSARARIIYASKDRVAEGEVTTYEDLASDKWRGRICTRSGTHDYNLALISAVIARYDVEYAEQWLQGVKANLARKPQGNDRAQVKAIYAGECDVSIGNMYYMGLMMADPEQKPWAGSVRLVFPKFDGGGTHLNVAGVAMTAAAPHRDDALKLMEFLASDKGQSIYAEVNNEYPVNTDVPASDLVASWGEFTPDNTPLLALATNRSEALRLVERVGFDE